MFKGRPTLVQQVIDQILENINNGVYDSENGGRLPSEQELGNALGVSRTTIRNAITILISDGIVVRRHGVGSFVNPPFKGGLGSWPNEKSSFLQLIRQTEQEPSVRLLNCEVDKAKLHAIKLQLVDQDDVLVMKKVLYSNGDPVILTTNIVPMKLVQEKYVSEVSSNYQCKESVYTFLKEKCDRNVAYHDSDLRAVSCEQEQSELLNMSEEKPILVLEELAFDEKNIPLFYGLSFIRSDIVSFRMRRGLSLGL